MDPQALALAQRALALAINALTTEGAPFRPFVVTEFDGVDTVDRVPGTTPAAQEAARAMATARTDRDAAAFTSIGSVNYGGREYAAVIVESWTFAANAGARVAIRFELTGWRKRPALVGSPLHVVGDIWFDPDDAPVEPAIPTGGIRTEPLDDVRNPLGNQAMFLGMSALMNHGTPFGPFAIIQKDGRREVASSSDQRVETAAESLRAYALTRTDADFIALVTDAYTTFEGPRTDTVHVEVWDSTYRAFRLGQAYVPVHPAAPGPAFVGVAMTGLADGTWEVSEHMALGGQTMYQP